MIKQYLKILLLIFSLSSPMVMASDDDSFKPLSDKEKLYGLSLIWKEASYNFAFFDQVPELDFDAEYQEAIPKVLKTKNLYDYYRELKRFVAVLNDGHTSVYFPDSILQEYYTSLGIQAIDAENSVVVVAIDKTLQSQIPLGSKILAVDGVAINEHLKKNIIPFLNDVSTDKSRRTAAIKNMLTEGKVGSEINLKIETPTKEISRVSLIREPYNKSRDYEYYDIDRHNFNDYDPITEFKWIDSNIAYVSLNNFATIKVADRFKSYFREARKAEALILDLRKNGGGRSDIGTSILSYLIDKDTHGAKWKSPKHIAAYKAWEVYKSEPKRAWEEGDMPIVSPNENAVVIPTYVLIGRSTGSAAEDFLVYTDEVEHFTTIGEETVGSTGQPLTFKLPGGGSVRICTKYDYYPNGKEFVGVGIQPDIYVDRTVDDVRNERDVVLLRAIAEAKKSVSK